MARKILLADDSVTAQNMGRKILADAGYEVITVNNGSAALKKIGEQRPDLIVLDVYMPGYSGLEVCQRLKDVGDTSQIPILLTVGKLEPFKPEEAKRARADGFIVKPFEASELLSALSKLEDKVVHRSESSKPGRAGRSHAYEESRYDKTMSVEEDTGWKNRIAFPSKKKEKDVREESFGTSAGSRPAERELRDSVEPKAAAAPRNGKSEDQRFDLGALAAAGLPKDVTPEEIAALAAAAARVKERLAQEEKSAQSTPEMAVVRPAELEVETQAVEVKPEVQAAPAVEAAATAIPEPEQKAPEIAETEKKIETAVAANAEPALVAADLKPEPAKAEKPESGNGVSSHSSETHPDEPVTMAVGAGADSASSSRWTAVAVALAPEESGISLEQEMQKAYAAFAAAESGHSAATGVVEANEIASSASSVASIEPEPTPAVPATVAPEAIQGLSAVASAAQDAVRAAVEELQSVAASYLKPKAAEPEAAAEATAVEPVAEVKAAEPAPAVAADAPVQPEVPAAAAERSVEESTIKESKPADGEVPVASESPEATPPSGAAEVKAEVSKESDLAETTAAAWADWKRIRETASDSAASPRDVAAMAAAVGAERRPEDAPSDSESDPAIASIVDSVLNDLRPKIVEEISRKLGKKR